jgi:lipid A 3-O-deacylase
MGICHRRPCLSVPSSTLWERRFSFRNGARSLPELSVGPSPELKLLFPFNRVLLPKLHMKCIFGASIGCLLILATSYGGDEIESKDVKSVFTEASPFDKGQREFQVSTGAMTSLFNFGAYRPKTTDIDESLLFGWMLSTPAGESVWRGNLEFLIEAHGALDVQGPKTGFVGGALGLRYNFVRPQSHWVPYVEVLGGGDYTDVDHDLNQHLIGRDEEFYLGVGFGIHYFVSSRSAISIEFRFRHNSDADTADRNIGLNSVGGMLGYSIYF